MDVNIHISGTLHKEKIEKIHVHVMYRYKHSMLPQRMKLQTTIRFFLRRRLFNFLLRINSETLPQTQCFISCCRNHSTAIWRHCHV